MGVFPSSEWAEAYRGALNASPAYADAARAWEGDVVLVVRPETPGEPGGVIRLDLAHGECREVQFATDPDALRAEFSYEGKRSDWLRLLAGELDPVRAIVGGTFRLRGNLAKAGRYTRAAKEMLEAATRVPRDP